MTTAALNYSLIPGQSKIFLEFLRRNSVERFYGGYPRGASALEEIAHFRLGSTFPRKEMSGALQSFNRRVGNSALAIGNAAKLAAEGTVAVVTGQQAGLFSGPALTLYKAVTAVLIAEKLREAGFNAVPIFWIASEDHDFGEIRETTFFDPEGRLHCLKAEGSEAHPLTAAQRRVGNQPRLFEHLKAILGPTEYGAQVLHWLQAAYRPEQSFSEAFGALMAGVLGRTGLVLLDASDPEVRRLSARLYVTAVEQADRVGEALQLRASELVSAGFEPQVHWASDYTLLFYVDTHGRRAVRRIHGGFAAGNTRWTVKELIGEIEAHSERFSPSALLRPVVQDALLPSVLYVGGPAEVAYFAQVQSLAPIFGWAPVIQPRMSVTLLDSRARRYMERNAVEVGDLLCPVEELLAKMIVRKVNPEIFAAWNEHLQSAAQSFNSLFEVANGLDAGLAASWRTSRRKIDYQLEKTRKKMLRTVGEKNDLVRSQAAYLHNLVYPDRTFQERKINFLSFYARFGPALVDRLLSLSPWEELSQVVTLQ